MHITCSLPFNPEMVAFVDYFSFMLISAATCLLCCCFCEEKTPAYLRWIAGACGANALLQALLYAMGMYNRLLMLILGQMLLAIAVIASMIATLQYVRSYKPRCGMLNVMAALVPVIGVGIGLFVYWQNDDTAYQFVFRCTLMVFICFNCAGMISRLLSSNYREHVERDLLKTYEEWSLKDAVTGLGNRRAFDQYIADIEKHRLDDAVLIFLDVNGLKNANDEHGHAAGDLLLQDVAAAIEKCFSTAGHCFRIGGDEFAVVLEDPADDDAAIRARLYADFDERNRNRNFHLSAAIGISHLIDANHVSVGLSVWKAVADREMYADKMREHLIAQTVDGQLNQDTDIDEMTGVLNAKGFSENVVKTVLSNPENQYAIWYCDIKKFKFINDFFGYEMGDRLLCYWSRLMLQMLEPGEICGRRIGDTMVALTYFTDEAALAKRFHFVADHVASFFQEDNARYAVSISCGVYVLRHDDMVKPDVSVMLDCANVAQKCKKNLNGSSLTFFTDEMWQRQRRDLQINRLLDHAITNRELEVYLQPQYNFVTNRLTGAEALCRWPRSSMGPISPAEFIPALERTGQIAKLDAFIWEEVCRLLHKWRGIAGMQTVSVSVNISRMDVLNSNIIDKLNELVARYELPPELLHLEITESAYMDRPENLI